jgi:hypothetical protein
MGANRITALSAIVGLTVGLLLMGTPPAAAQENCKPVDDAMSKIFTTPSHLYTTMTAVPNNGDKPVITELIYAGGAIYSNRQGKWARSTVTLQKVTQMEQENRRNSKYTCRYLRDEAVNGEAAAVYGTHSERTDELKVKSDGQIWISKAKGLPLRHEEDIESEGTKNHHSTRYEYTNVQPPL